MASFDIKSLFTNIPVSETSNIILSTLFPQESTIFSGFTRNLFEKMLNNCVKNNVFLHNGVLYEQIDGCPMGGCISPTMANVFLCHHETKWLDNCPQEFKPVLYRRYVDDCFLLFKDMSHVDMFHNYLNSQHERMKFTCEVEENGSLPFFDVLVSKENGYFNTSVYRKTTNAGLGMKFNSAISNKYKFNLIDCMIDRAYKINSTVYGFTQEISKLKRYFAQNKFNQFSVNQQVQRKLAKIESDNNKDAVLTCAKITVFAQIPFMSNFSNNQLSKSISGLVSEFFPHVDLRLCFKNEFTTSSLFRFKDEIPRRVRSNIVYEYKCGMCNSRYIGETARHYATRVAEHMGVSPRTGAPMSKVNSNIHAHFLQTGHRVCEDNFSILCSRASMDLKTAESIAIHHMKPDLNDKIQSVPLEVLC